MHPNPFTAASEFVDRELTRCQTIGRPRRDALSAGERLCQIAELLDFHEWQLLHSPTPYPMPADHGSEEDDVAAD